MEPILYSASPLKAYAGGIFMVVLFFVLGVFGVLSALFDRSRKNNSILKRIFKGLSGGFLFLCGIASAFLMFREYQTGVKTILVRVEEKRIVESNCPDGGVCKHYNAETTDGNKLYVFGLGKAVWEKVQEGACYEFTYFPSKSLLGDYLQEENQPPSPYEPTGTITLIEQANCQ